MTHLLPHALIVWFFWLSVPAAAELIAWNDLIDKDAQSYNDPFLNLDYDQLNNLRTYATEQARIEDADRNEEQQVASIARLEEAANRLEAAGINPAELLSQRWVVAERRKRAATAVNPRLDGAQITLGGFVVPAPPAEDGTLVVYLVPERGMCSHVPPPDPNQMIRARISSDWSPSMLHEPVLLTGQLYAMDTQHTFHILDGNVPMRASFIMEVIDVETLDASKANAQKRNASIQDRAIRSRASRNLLQQEELRQK